MISSQNTTSHLPTPREAIGCSTTPRGVRTYSQCCWKACGVMIANDIMRSKNKHGNAKYQPRYRRRTPSAARMLVAKLSGVKRKSAIARECRQNSKIELTCPQQSARRSRSGRITIPPEGQRSAANSLECDGSGREAAGGGVDVGFSVPAGSDNFFLLIQ